MRSTTFNIEKEKKKMGNISAVKHYCTLVWVPLKAQVFELEGWFLCDISCVSNVIGV